MNRRQKRQIHEPTESTDYINRQKRHRRVWREESTYLADSIKTAQDGLSVHGIYKAELMAALQRIKSDHVQDVVSESKQLQLTNQAKRDSELNRRITTDPNHATLVEDLKKINQKMTDLGIEIEYNRNMLKIRLAEVHGLW